jgi:uncharacterized protein
MCNLRCKYCFYHSIAENRQTESYGLMTEETLEILVKRTFDYAEQSCTFAFQGGEPTLIGLDFYRKLIELEKKYNKNEIQVQNSIQTNGVLINEEWAEFFANNHFLVGISLDGPKDIHDANRFDINNNGSFSKVMNAIRCFNKYNVEYNILSVVNSYTARHIEKIYKFFEKNNFQYLQFIPCLDPLNETPGQNDFSLTPIKYADFLKKIFDLWYIDIKKGKMLSIRHLDNYVSMLMGYPPESCGMSGKCTCYFVVEAGGQVSPCDFYVTDNWQIGNIKSDDFESMINSTTAKDFVSVSCHVSQECRVCKYMNICRGGCRRNREPFSEGLPSLNYYCSSYKQFFDYSMERMIELARMFMNRR